MRYNIVDSEGVVINTILYDPEAINEKLMQYEEDLKSYEKQLKKHERSMELYYKKYDMVAAEYIKQKKFCRDEGIETTPELRKAKRELNKVPRPPKAPVKPLKPSGHYVVPNGCKLEKVE